MNSEKKAVVSSPYVDEVQKIWDDYDKQPFEKHIELAKHIERMANTGTTGGGTKWCAFLRELNKAVK